MGMTDDQFNSYKKRILRELERAIVVMPTGREKDDLQQLIDDLREELRKP